MHQNAGYYLNDLTSRFVNNEHEIFDCNVLYNVKSVFKMKPKINIYDKEICYLKYYDLFSKTKPFWILSNN